MTKLIEIPDLLPREVARFRDRHQDVLGCWEWRGERSDGGYGVFTLYRGGRELALVASRVSWVIEHGPIPDGMFVLHACDNPPCVNPAHLFIGTHADNMADMVAKGRQAHNPLHAGTIAAKNRLKTACPKCGGQFVESPHQSQRTSSGRGRRRCPRCKAAWQAEYMTQWKAARRRGDGAPVIAACMPTTSTAAITDVGAR